MCWSSIHAKRHLTTLFASTPSHRRRSGTLFMKMCSSAMFQPPPQAPQTPYPPLHDFTNTARSSNARATTPIPQDLKLTGATLAAVPSLAEPHRPPLIQSSKPPKRVCRWLEMGRDPPIARKPCVRTGGALGCTRQGWVLRRVGM